MGRQLFVVCLVFFSAKLTTIHGKSEGGFLFYVPDWVQVSNLKLSINPNGAGGRNVPTLFSEGYFSLFLHEKRGLEVQNFSTFPNSL